MPRRVTLTDRQKDALLRLPTSQADLLKHYTLSDEDLGHIRQRRRPHNRFGFALQLGAPWESLQYYPLRDFWRDGKQMISA